MLTSLESFVNNMNIKLRMIKYYIQSILNNEVCFFDENMLNIKEKDGLLEVLIEALTINKSIRCIYIYTKFF